MTLRSRTGGGLFSGRPTPTFDFHVPAVGLSLISIHILVRTIGWVRSLKKEKTQG